MGEEGLVGLEVRSDVLKKGCDLLRMLAFELVPEFEFMHITGIVH